MRAMSRRRPPRGHAGLRRAPAQPPPPAGSSPRAAHLPLRRARRLRRVPRSAAPPHAHHRVAAAQPGARLHPSRRRRRRGRAALFDDAMRRSAALHDLLVDDFPEQAAYAVSLAYKVRFMMQMNAREAMHMLELRTSPQGHPVVPRRRPAHAPPHRRQGGPSCHRRDDALRRPHERTGPRTPRLPSAAPTNAVLRSPEPVTRAPAPPRRMSPGQNYTTNTQTTSRLGS